MPAVSLRGEPVELVKGVSVDVEVPARAEIVLTDPWEFAELADAIEAWGFRAIQERGEAINRRELAFQWLGAEYRPVVAMMREADLIGDETETEAYMRISAERYRLLRTHHWDEEVLRRVVEGKKERKRSPRRRKSPS